LTDTRGVGGINSGIEQPEGFWALRPCFLPPIPELAAAADLLDEAADALLAGDRDRARKRLREANIPAVHAFAAKIMGPWDVHIHRRRPMERPTGLLKAQDRRPSQSVEAKVFARDGWQCRYCGVRVVLPKARRILVDTFPDVVCWSGKDKDLHAAFYALSAVADHVVPHTLGGGSDENNLVTTCQCCNYGKGDRLLAEVGLIDPRTRPVVVNGWDGLERVLSLPEPKRNDEPVPDASINMVAWAIMARGSEFDRVVSQNAGKYVLDQRNPAPACSLNSSARRT
jgi:5-methylcytosine-specific restriction endonuclease McrA